MILIKKYYYNFFQFFVLIKNLYKKNIYSYFYTGYGQEVRQRFLIPLRVGSNPTTLIIYNNILNESKILEFNITQQSDKGRNIFQPKRIN